MADGLDAALRMPLSQRRERWGSLWRAIAEASPLNWGRSFLAGLLRAALMADTPAVRSRLRIERSGDGITMIPGQPIGPILPGPRQVN